MADQSERQTRRIVRASPGAQESGSAPEVLSADQVASLEARNGLLQFDKMVALIQDGLSGAKLYRLRLSSILDLHREATRDIEPDAGSFRVSGIEIRGSNHKPPPPEEVPRLMEALCDEVQARWDRSVAVHLAAYAMWRLNWIHPFSDGNGRTSRVVGYLLLCVKLGFLLPGTPTIPERIASNKLPYYTALDAADASLSPGGAEDLSALETLLAECLRDQLQSIHEKASGDRVGAIYTPDDDDPRNPAPPPQAS